MPKVSDEHRATRRRQVLDAAVECFARQGFHRATMQDIIREAGLSAGAVYGYFAAKDEIIEAIAAERHARERDLIGQIHDLPVAEVLRRLAREFIGGLARREEQKRRRVGVQVWAEALREPRVMRLVRRGIDEPLRLLTKVIDEARQRGEIAPDLDPQAVSRAVMALFHGFVLQQSWDPGVRVEPYLAVIDAAIDAALAHPGATLARDRKRPGREALARSGETPAPLHKTSARPGRTVAKTRTPPNAAPS